MGLLAKLKGDSPTKVSKALCYVFGEDKRFSRRKMETTGVYFQDNNNRLAYDSFPNAIGILTQRVDGNMQSLGPVSVLYEPTSRPFGFSDLNWLQEEHKEDVILDTAFAEGCARAVQREDKQEWLNKLTTILLAAVLGAVALTFLVAAQTGILSSLFSDLPKFFGR